MLFLVLTASLLLGQTPATPASSPAETPSVKPLETRADEKPAEPASDKPAAEKKARFEVARGTNIPVSMINSVSTKTAGEGDKVYMETVFPVLSKGKVVIPPGSYVAGTISRVKRPGRVKGRGEFYLIFDSITLPNGTTRDFRGRVTSMDGRASEELDKTEGKIKSEGNKAGDAQVIAGTTMTGLGVGTLIGATRGGAGMGAVVGTAAGAAAGAMMVLLSRGPDAVLARGTTFEMVLDRDLSFAESELDFSNSTMQRGLSNGSGPLPSQRNRQVPARRGWGIPF
jgi:type IV secretion system protein VirB10